MIIRFLQSTKPYVDKGEKTFSGPWMLAYVFASLFRSRAENVFPLRKLNRKARLPLMQVIDSFSFERKQVQIVKIVASEYWSDFTVAM